MAAAERPGSLQQFRRRLAACAAARHGPQSGAAVPVGGLSRARPGPVAGEGRVHQCLRDSFSKLTEACRKEELKLNIIQARDVRLRPKLNKACSEEIAVFCKGVPPGARPRTRPCPRPTLS